MEGSFKILRPYLRGLPLIILAMVFGFLIARKYLSYVTPMYESTAKIKLADINEGIPHNNLFKDFDVFASSTKIASEIEVMKSQMLLNKVLDVIDFNDQIFRLGKLKNAELYHDSPVEVFCTTDSDNTKDIQFDFKVQNEQSYLLYLENDKEHPVQCKFGESYTFPDMKVHIELSKNQMHRKEPLKIIDTYRFLKLNRVSQLESVQKNLDISSVDKDVPVIRISYKSANPIKAANLVNALAEAYIKDYVETRYGAAKTTVNFLEDQINNTIAKLSNSENNIQRYRDRKGITNIPQETETDLRKISQLKIQQTNLKMNLEAIEELEDYIKKGKQDFLSLAPNFEAFTDLLSTEIVKKIKAYQAEKRDLLLTYTPEDNRVKVIDQKIGDLTSYLVESISNTKRNLESKYRNLTNDITESEKVFISVPEKERMLTIMNRDFALYQQSYNFLNEKKIEAEIAESSRISFHRIITPAQISKSPVSPNKTIIQIIAALIGMISAILFITAFHQVKARVNDKSTIESASLIPVALTTPKLKNAQAIENHFQKEALQLEIKGLVKDKCLVCISAYNEKDGAAFNTVHLALALARQNRRVLIFDAEQQLSGSLLQAISKEESHEIILLNLSNPEFNRFSKDDMTHYINQFRSQYDIVLILNESLTKNQKALHFLSMADTNLIVLDSRLTSQKRILETDVLKAEYHLPSVYFLLNRAGYQPNVFTDSYKTIARLFKRSPKKISQS